MLTPYELYTRRLRTWTSAGPELKHMRRFLVHGLISVPAAKQRLQLNVDMGTCKLYVLLAP